MPSPISGRRAAADVGDARALRVHADEPGGGFRALASPVAGAGPARADDGADPAATAPFRSWPPGVASGRRRAAGPGAPSAAGAPWRAEGAGTRVTGSELALALPLDPEQQEAVLAPLGPVCVLAGAGTGKTRAITARIAHQVRSGMAPPGTFLAVTFTTRAAGDARTASSARGRRRRRRGRFTPPRSASSPTSGRRLSVASRREWSSRRRRCSCGRLRGLGCHSRGRKSVTSRVRSSGRRRRSTGPGDYAAAAAAAGRTPTRGPAVLADLFTRYETVKRAAGACDFEDILLLTCAVLEGESRRSRARYGAVTATSSWTNTRTSPRCNSGFSTRGSVAAKACVRRR